MATALFELDRPNLDHGEPWRQSRPLADRPIRLGAGDDLYAGQERQTDWVYGQGGDDALQGFSGADRLYGGGGDDFLNGGKGRDLLVGGSGNDELVSEGGHDVLDGGAGADVIDVGHDDQLDRVVFSQASDSLPGAVHDTVVFFESGVDRIDLRPIDADSSASGNDAFTWIGGAAFDGVAGELRFEAGSKLLQGDVDGDGTADFEVFFSDGHPQVTDILL